MRLLLDNIFGSNFKEQYNQFSVPPIPCPLSDELIEPDQILIQLTNSTEYEITALEVFKIILFIILIIKHNILVIILRNIAVIC